MSLPCREPTTGGRVPGVRALVAPAARVHLAGCEPACRGRRVSPARAFWPPLLWAVLLLGIGSIPDVRAPASTLPLDKLAHLLLYGVLGVLLGRAWHRTGRRPALTVLLGLGLLTGALDEGNQARVPGRSADPADWLMDALGVTLGFATGASARRRPRTPTTTND